MTDTIRLNRLPFSIRISNDKLSAFLKLLPGSAWENSEDNLRQVLAAIREAGIAQVDEDLLRAAMSDVVSGREGCVAKGIAPVHGEPGRIDFLFDAKPAASAWARDETQKVDFHQGGVVNNVAPDQLLGQLVPPIPGQDGVNVFGQPLVARPGRPARIVAGRNVRLGDDGEKAYAEIEGCAKRERSKIAVDHVRIVQGDVDFHTGNIEFNGDVVVLGDVKETFRIDAHGNIRIYGTVDRASLKAGADIIVEGGVYGKEGVEAVAEGDLTVGFAENAALRAGGCIYVRGAMVNSVAQAGEKVCFRAVGKSLIGGSVYAAYGVESNSLGNPRLPTKTVVEFGPSPDLPQRIRSLKNELDRTEDEAQRVRLGEEIRALLEEYRAQSAARVTVRQTVYPGVVLVCDKASYEAKHEIDGMMFYKVEGRNEISMRACDASRR
ncbi:DUF342 domain-containing protein [Candidatus Sumerlaeota bacterium]|nr:DUF342 domain-containing protein [Candidatus Sumerlaeota bacterium]